MKALRASIVVASALLLGGGYLASQAAFLNRTAAEYMERVEASPAPYLALVILVASVVLAALPQEKPEE